jgi:hypothetical protein
LDTAPQPAQVTTDQLEEAMHLIRAAQYSHVHANATSGYCSHHEIYGLRFNHGWFGKPTSQA